MGRIDIILFYLMLDIENRSLIMTYSNLEHYLSIHKFADII